MRRVYLGMPFMQQVQLYQQAQRRATAAGFATVDDFVADVLSHDIYGDTEDLDHIDKAEAQIKAGAFYTADQAYAGRAEWLRQNPR